MLIVAVSLFSVGCVSKKKYTNLSKKYEQATTELAHLKVESYVESYETTDTIFDSRMELLRQRSEISSLRKEMDSLKNYVKESQK